jgi:hypothetical protein
LDFGEGDIVRNQERFVLSSDSLIIVEHHHLISEARIHCGGGGIAEQDVIALSKIGRDMIRILAPLR